MELHVDQWPKKKLELIEAAITTLAQEGFDRSTTAKIAKFAGVGEGTLYRYFKNKEDLIHTAALYTASLLFGPARQNFDPETSIEAQFIQFCQDFLGTVLANYIFIKNVFYFSWRGQFFGLAFFTILLQLLPDNIVAELNTLVAHIH
jgi:AcrR family transcriptional regulator